MTAFVVKNGLISWCVWFLYLAWLHFNEMNMIEEYAPVSFPFLVLMQCKWSKIICSE